MLIGGQGAIQKQLKQISSSDEINLKQQEINLVSVKGARKYGLYHLNVMPGRYPRDPMFPRFPQLRRGTPLERRCPALNL